MHVALVLFCVSDGSPFCLLGNGKLFCIFTAPPPCGKESSEKKLDLVARVADPFAGRVDLVGTSVLGGELR